LFLSYQRADGNGRKISCSSYIDEVLRLLTGKTSEDNPAVDVVAKHHREKFFQPGIRRLRVVPSRMECSMLTGVFAPEEILDQIHQTSPEIAESLKHFASKLSSIEIEPALPVDGCINPSESMWSSLLDENKTLRLSYSRFKNYLNCPFQFYSAVLLQLLESPREAGQEEHDIPPPLKGKISEDVVKGAIGYIARGKAMKDAIALASRDVQQKYRNLFPDLLLNLYLRRFRKGAEVLLPYLEREGCDLSRSRTPQRADVIEMELVPPQGLRPSVRIRGIPDLILCRPKDKDLIGELKWGTKAVGNTLSFVWNSHEAQFCIYSPLIRAQEGWLDFFPFRYFRLDAFAEYGDPARMIVRIEELLAGAKITPELPARFYGACANDKEIDEYFGKAVQKANHILSGNFRIIKDPGFLYAACTNCSFTQLCRRTHTPTLLRSKQVEHP
jgi:hypothetical protein